MQTLKMKIPEGYEFDFFDKLSGEIMLKEKPKSVFERIKTVDDVLADHGFTTDEFMRKYSSLDEDEKAYKLLKMLSGNSQRRMDA